MSERFILSAPASKDLDGILTYLLEREGPSAANTRKTYLGCPTRTARIEEWDRIPAARP